MDHDNYKNDETNTEMIDMLVSKPGVIFGNSQRGERELEPEEKRKIALSVLKQGSLSFLKQFGQHLDVKHLDDFHPNQEDEELCFVLDKLKMAASPSTRKLLVKNRRYEALSRLKRDNSYFNEVEMMRRNPLLYEQLVGRYLSEDERKKRDNVDTENITLLNVLLEGIDRDRTRTLLKEKQEEEECQMEEEENSSDECDENDESDEEDIKPPRWGEMIDDKEEKPINHPHHKLKRTKEIFITGPERTLLREEFIQEMYRSFLAGEDTEFDYSTVDDNSSYDCVEVMEQDEEDEYFDSESPNEITEQVENVKEKPEDHSEDELDAYMDALSRHPALQNLTQEEL